VNPSSLRPPRIAAALLAVALAIAGCSSGPILANAPVVRPSPPATPTPAPRPPDPRPIAFPRDDGPHDRLTEWWYYTGHLRDVSTGARYGFEFVVFRAERGDFPVSWASHLAVTDEGGDSFAYAQRSEIGPQVDRSPRVGGSAGEPVGFALHVSDPDPSAPASAAWSMSGSAGHDRLVAAMAEAEVAGSGARPAAIDLTLSATRPPTLHDGDGWIDFGPAGGSYYYSRTRMAAAGTLTLGGRALTVDGTAWFDHQWGDFISVGGGGWDWFAVNLADGTDLTLSLVRDATGSLQLGYGTLVRPDGTAHNLPADAFTVDVTDHWTSPRTGAVYPAGWAISLPGEGLSIRLVPSVADQELDTRQTTGVVYWEGSQRVTAARDGRSLAGEAYVELTGYAPASDAASPTPSSAP
jgi:predicted secreted hydrolase